MHDNLKKLVGTSKEDFERWYEKANPWGFDNSFNDRSRQSILLEYIRHGRFKKCLDIGCAEGVLSKNIAKYVDHLDAFDISGKAIKRAIAVRQDEKINYYQKDARDFRANNSYDLIVCSEVLYYLNPGEQCRLIEEIRKSLADNGLFIMTAVVSGKNHYREYFTFDSVSELLREYFRIIVVFPSVVNLSFLKKKDRLLACVLSIIKYLCSVSILDIEVYTNMVKMVDPRDTYQSGFVCVKKCDI